LLRDLDRLTADVHDVLVVGGGIHGAAVAWEASSRGLRVALVEARDFGSGASWNSLKTIHGGLRHLQRLHVGQLRDSAREQQTLLRIAPGLVRPLPFLVPVENAARAGMLLAGLTGYRLLAGPSDGLPAGRVVGREEAVRLAPHLADVPMSGAAVWHDAQAVSTERLLLSMLHVAEAAGAALANRVRVTGLSAGPEAVAVDELTGRELRLRARSVVNVTGHGLDAVLRAARVSPPASGWLSAMNVVFRRPMAGPAVGMRSGGRYLFAVPWRDVTMLGTDYAAADSVAPEAQALRFAREGLALFPFLGLKLSDVSVVHHGLVPGDGRGGLRTTATVRDHAEDGLPGVVSVWPVKYTTARSVAETLLTHLGASQPSRSASTVLPEAPAGSLAERTLYAVRSEMALSLEDLVLRRLDLGSTGMPSPEDVELVAAVAGSELGWDAAQLERERQALAGAYTLSDAVRAQRT
jgi:glycerol-3-phosphate dehydrogenase